MLFATFAGTFAIVRVRSFRLWSNTHILENAVYMCIEELLDGCGVLEQREVLAIVIE